MGYRIQHFRYMGIYLPVYKGYLPVYFKGYGLFGTPQYKPDMKLKCICML